MKETRLRKLRKQKGFNASYIAKYLGVSARHFQRIESERKYLNHKRIKQLAKIYGVKMTEIREALHE